MLQDVKGFRAPAINALNAATRRQKIIGGDVTPTESDEGTVLTINDYAAIHPFRLFSGIIYPEGAEGVGCALGKVFVAGESMAIVPGIDVLLSPEDASINPNPYAWCLKALPTYNGAIEWRLVRWKEAVYIIARIGETPVEECIKEGETIAAADVETLAIIGTLSSDAGGNSVSIEQVVTSDVYYGGGAAAESRFAWSIWAEADENGAQTWKVFEPQWVTQGETITLGAGVVPLPISQVAAKTLYAVLRYSVSWETLETSILGLSVDTEVETLVDTPVVFPSGTGSSATAGQDGIYHYKVPIGKWTQDGEEAPFVWEQWHIGLIIADPPSALKLTKTDLVTEVAESEGTVTVRRGSYLTAGKCGDIDDTTFSVGGGEGGSGYCVGPIRIEMRDTTVGSSGTTQTPYIVQYFAKVTENEDGTLTLEETDKIAVETMAKRHSDDHTSGVV